MSKKSKEFFEMYANRPAYGLGNLIREGHPEYGTTGEIPTTVWLAFLRKIGVIPEKNHKNIPPLPKEE